MSQRSALTLFLIWSLISVPKLSRAADPVLPAESTTLNLYNGDYVSGTLANSPEPGFFGWRSSSFTTNLQFPIERVSSIHFTPPAVLPQPEGNYGMELLGGDLIFGTLLKIDADGADFDVPVLGGQLRIDRSKIRRLFRRGTGNEQLYVGPTGLNGWRTTGEARAWREMNGYLVTNKPDSALRRQFNFPARARMEFDLSWTSQADFDLAIAVGEKPESIAEAFHIEVWDNQIVLHRQTEKDADLAPLQPVSGHKSEHLHIQAFLDQTVGRMLVFSSDGKKIADLKVKPSNKEHYGGIQLTNRKGDIRLERLQIGSWNGEPPQEMSKDKSRIHGTDGTITYGQLTSFDAEKHEFVVGEGADAKSIPEEKVQDLFLAEATENPITEVRAITTTAMKLSGDYVKVDDGKVWLKTIGIQEPVQIPLNALQTILVLKTSTENPVLPGLKGRLEINGLTLWGCLVDGQVTETGGLNWQPMSSSKASPIAKGVSGQIVYRETPANKVITAEDDSTRPQNIGQAQQRALKARVNAATKTLRKGTKAEKAMLHLRTGDTVPCDAVSIDENGFTFKSSMTDATFVPHSQIQAVELLPNVVRKEIDPNKKSRLLTVPRMQRTNPPTHLIRSVEGDYLRGRLIAMNADEVEVELRVDAKTIPRDKIARILWLHPESSETTDNAAAADQSDQTNLIQALPTDGNRLTFVPERIEAGVLHGTSQLLGSCKVDLQTVDQLFMGHAIDQATADLPFQWKLKKAADPLAPKESSEGSEEGSEGMESALVGKVAPDIDLLTLDGTQIRLSDYKGKVVILDFWASWCGPCLQVMPQVDKVAHDFAGQGVLLFAINLEEPADKVRAALERLKISPTVLLDKNGRVAERYGATAIPQTVIIDREGVIARLYVGGSARFGEQLSVALKSVLDGESKKVKAEDRQNEKAQPVR